MDTKKFITIIFPSRARIELTKKLLLSIEEQTYNKDWIEVISICDHDDKETLDLFHEMSPQLTYDFKFVSRKQNKKLDLPNDYYSLGLKLASDSYFTWILGNDCELYNQNWDIYFYNSLNQSVSNWKKNIEENQKYFYIKIDDDTHWDNTGKHINKNIDASCCFPLLSSNYCNTLGEFYPVEIPTWGGDGCLYTLIKHSNVSTIVDATSIIGVKHYSMHNQRTAQDDISKKIEKEHTEYANTSEYWQNQEIITKIFKKRKHFLYND